MATNYVSCPSCHSQNPANYQTCTNCGTMLPISPMPMQPAGGYGAQKLPGADKKIAAGICGIVLGGLGIHKFVLGYQQEGIIMLSVYLVSFIIALVTCGIGTPLIFITTIIGIIEGVIYLTKSDEEFVQTYVLNKKPWF
jgi:TM2 domain-containing membrane protein YozV